MTNSMQPTRQRNFYMRLAQSDENVNSEDAEERPSFCFGRIRHRRSKRLWLRDLLIGVMLASLLCVGIVLLATFYGSDAGEFSDSDEEIRARRWLKEFDLRMQQELFSDTSKQWAYNVNVTDENSAAAAEADAALTAFQIAAAANASQFDAKQIRDPVLKRLLKKIGRVGIKLGPTDALALSKILANLTAMYSTAKVCALTTENQEYCRDKWSLDPDLTRIMARSRDLDLLKYVWKAWRDATGPRIKSLYYQFVDLSNKGARADGFQDTGDWWRFNYDDPTFRQSVEKLWYEVLPMYEELHAFVRRKLYHFYSQATFNTSGIPAHILGNMWSQSWGNVFNITAPYPQERAIDVTDEMVAQGYDALRMFHTADDFFGSLGLIRMPKPFWNQTMMIKPKDREVVCHASAWDFYNSNDFRIKMCTDITMDELITIHHEMGHIEYYLQYKEQPVTFREGANDGFHEAIGDTMALSSGTPKHLQLIGLLKDYKPNDHQTINYLYNMALDKVAFLPFGYLIDNWRWNVFDGSSPYPTWNRDWWALRTRYQGIVAPVLRSEDDFDPGAKFHIPGNTPYLRYFISFIIQFQFYEALCNASGHTGPLHECDFYNSISAGALLSSVLKLGSSRPWQEAMEIMTGQRDMKASSLKRYFKPLIDWLKKENQANNVCYGWAAEWPAEVLKTLPTPRCTEFL